MKSYNTLNDYYRNLFGEKTFKVPIDAGFDCPNRDGTVAHGGCTFCTVSGSGDAIVAPDAPIREQFYKEIDFMHRKWPEVKKYLVYFQNFTNTHEKLEVIRERYEQAINEPGVVGINIGTRPDCLPDETIEYLAELSERMHVTVELGLQTTYEETSELINRAHSYELYVDTVKRLRKYPKIEIVAHLINGLPGETHEMMVENVRRCVRDNDIQGIKLHLLHLMTNTRMQRDYHEGRLQLMSQDEYVKVICDQLEIIPKHIVIHRITGDAPREMLIGPMWSLNKWEVLNSIEAEMRRRGSVQGCKAVKQEFMNEKNGHDTLFLAKLAKQVYAFDIQEQALEKTSQRLQEAGLTNIELILQGHETVDQFVTEVKAAIFNLGYLPSADKSIITQPQTTLEALEKLCQMLIKGGRIAIMIYYGHDGGDIERDAVMDFVSHLPQQEYTAMIYRTLNQINNPPFLVMIEKLERYRYG